MTVGLVYKVDDIVYSGRPPLYNCKIGDSQYKAKVIQVLPARRRAPLSYLLQFIEPDSRDGETTSVVVPGFRRNRPVVFAADDDTTDALHPETNPLREEGNDASSERVELDPDTSVGPSEMNEMTLSPDIESSVAPVSSDIQLSSSDDPAPIVPVYKTLDYLLTRFKSTTLKMCLQQLGLRASGSKMQRAERMVSHFNQYPSLSWTPPEPDKGIRAQDRDNYSVPIVVTTTSWLTAGEHVPEHAPQTTAHTQEDIENEPSETSIIEPSAQECEFPPLMNVPYLGKRLKPKMHDGPDYDVIKVLLKYLDEFTLYRFATLSWKVAEVVAAMGYRLDDESRWNKPIHFTKNSLTDGMQWKRHLDIVFPPEADVELSKYNLAVQYLSRVSKLHKRQQTPWIYHKPQCSDCQIPTRSWHVMWMKYVCTKCVNNNVMTNCIISRDVAKR